MSQRLIELLLESPTPKHLASEVAGYTRFSSENQDESSIAQQVHRCKEHAAKEGKEIAGDLLFSDEAISGANPNRPGLLEMIHAASQGRFSTLYVDSLSRLARDAMFSMLIISYLKSLGIRIVSVSENSDSARPGSELDTKIRSVLHDEYSLTHRSNVQRGQEGAIRNGHSCGDYVFGYLSEAIPGTEYGRRSQRKHRRCIVIDEQNAKTVLRMFKWYVSDNWAISHIVRELNKLGSKKDHRSSRPSWDHSNVLSILRNTKYVGIWVWGKTTRKRHPIKGSIRQVPRGPAQGEPHTRYCPELRIVPQELFDAAQLRLSESSNKHNPPRRTNGRLSGSKPGHNLPRHLLQDLCWCAICGAKYYTSGPRYMRCRNHLNGLCSAKVGLKRTDASKQILDRLAGIVASHDDWLNDAIECAREAIRERWEQYPRRRTEIEHQITSIQGKVNRLVAQCEDADQDTACVLHRQIQERSTELRRLDCELEKVARDAETNCSCPSAEEVRQKFCEVFKILRGDVTSAAVALQQLIGRIAVHEVSIEGEKRKELELRFRLDSRNLLRTTLPGAGDKIDECSSDMEVVIRLGRSSEIEQTGVEMKKC